MVVYQYFNPQVAVYKAVLYICDKSFKAYFNRFILLHKDDYIRFYPYCK